MLASIEFDFARVVPGAHAHVVLFTEHLDATYYAYFHFLFSALADQGLVSFHVLSRRKVEKHGHSPFQLVEALTAGIDPDVVIFNRYARPHGCELLRQFGARGIAVLYHIDDDFLSLPPELGESVIARHGDPAVVEERERLIATADAVLPSTDRLAAALLERVPRAKMLTPAPPPYLAPFVAATPASDGQVIGYMASKSHAADLEMILPAIVRVLEARPLACFEIYGTLRMPQVLEERFGARIARHPPSAAYPSFLERLAQLGWAVGLAPLAPTRFNACKSAIKFLEYSACGIPTIASAGPVYTVISHGKNGLIADSADRWDEAIGRLLDDPELRLTLVQQARQDCESAFSFGNSKSRLLYILQALMRSKRPVAG